MKRNAIPPSIDPNKYPKNKNVTNNKKEKILKAINKSLKKYISFLNKY